MAAETTNGLHEDELLENALAAVRADPCNLPAMRRILVAHLLRSAAAQSHFMHLQLPETLLLVAEKDADANDALASVLDGIAADLAVCVSCINEYYAARNAFFAKYSHSLQPEYLRNLKISMLQWDRSRLKKHIQTLIAGLETAVADNDANGLQTVRKQSLNVIYEILNHPEPLRDKTVDLLFITLLENVQNPSRINLKDVIFPGMVILACHANEFARSWALSSIRKSSLSIPESRLKAFVPIISDIAENLRKVMHMDPLYPNKVILWNLAQNENDIWPGIFTIFSAIHQDNISALLKMTMPDADKIIATTFIHRNPAAFWERLAFFRYVLSYSNCAWLSSPHDFMLESIPVVFNNIILATEITQFASKYPNPIDTLSQYYSAQQTLDIFFDWMHDFIDRITANLSAANYPNMSPPSDTDQHNQQMDADDMSPHTQPFSNLDYTQIPTSSWLGESISAFITQAASWSENALSDLALNLLHLMDTRFKSITLFDNIISYTISIRHSIMPADNLNQTMLKYIRAIVSRDVHAVVTAEAEYLESAETPDTYFNMAQPPIHMKVWEAVASQPLWDEAIAALLPVVLPMRYLSFIHQGLCNLEQAEQHQDVDTSVYLSNASAQMLLAIRSLTRFASDRHTQNLSDSTLIGLLIFNDPVVQRHSRRLTIVSTHGASSFEEALTLRSRIDCTTFLRILYKNAYWFDPDTLQPGNILTTLQGVIELLSIVNQLAFDDRFSATRIAGTMGISLNPNGLQAPQLWMHGNFMSFYALRKAALWSKARTYSTTNLVKLGTQAITTLHLLYHYIDQIYDNMPKDVIYEWERDSLSLLATWSRTNDESLRELAFIQTINVLDFSAKRCILLKEQDYQKMTRLQPIMERATDAQKAIYKRWVSVQENLGDVETDEMYLHEPDEHHPSNGYQHDLVSMDESPSNMKHENGYHAHAYTTHQVNGHVPPRLSPYQRKGTTPVIEIPMHPSGRSQHHSTQSQPIQPREIMRPQYIPSNTFRPPNEGMQSKPARRPSFGELDQVYRNGRAPTENSHRSTHEHRMPPRHNVPIPIPPKFSTVNTKGMTKIQQMRVEASIQQSRNKMNRSVLGEPPGKGIKVSEPRIYSRDEIDPDYNNNRPKRTVMVLGLSELEKRMGNAIQTPFTKKMNQEMGNIKNLFRSVLKWHPEESSAKLPPTIDESALTRIPDEFENPKEYIRTFEPLLQLECWEQFMQARNEINSEDTLSVVLTHIALVDDMNELTFTAPPGEVKLQQWSENVILHLTHQKSNAKFLCRVTSVSLRGSGGTDATIVCDALVSHRPNVLPFLRPTSSWFATQVFSLTTTLREYQAMLALSSMPLAKDILKPTLSAIEQPDLNKIDSLVDVLGVNEPQARAISAAIEQKSGFVLIQGPPGTGKTKTILGLIGAMHKASTPIRVPVATNRPVSLKLLDKSKRDDNTDSNGAPATDPLIKARLRLLCCAPSNAAIDEIARRLKEGIRDSRGQLYRPRIVRVGTTSVHPAVRDVTLDALVEKHLKTDEAYLRVSARLTENETTKTDLLQEMARLREERDTLRALETKAMEDSMRTDNEVSTRLKEINARIAALRKQMSEEVTARGTSGMELDRARRNLRTRILASAEVVLTTLSGSGHDQFADLPEFRFPTVVVDEACQAIELSCLIPLRYGATKCIMVGDPNQLPPTVISQFAQKFSYEQSLFQRIMKKRRDDIHLLSIQYRMHPEISQFPSKCFYDSRLLDAEGVEEKCAAEWHEHRLSRPYLFLDVHEGVEQAGSTKSILNVEEARVCVKLVQKICQTFPNVNFASRIGVITFYKLQMRKLKDMFVHAFGRRILEVVDINTVDGFQGQEKDIIILSCVRTNIDRGIGFLNDIRRMNVALTRARHSLIILAHSHALKTDPVWSNLVDDAKSRGVTLKIASSSLSIRPGSKFNNMIGTESTAKPSDAEPTEKESERCESRSSAQSSSDDNTDITIRPEKSDAPNNTNGDGDSTKPNKRRREPDSKSADERQKPKHSRS